MLERQRNDMLTLFSHDMRAPLTSLIILIDTQARRSGDGQMKQQFARIGKLARHTLALADGFAQLSRAEASDYERVPVNLADLMNEARDAVWPLAHRKSMSIDDVPRRDDTIVQGDPALLSRALINLLDNAIKYSASLTGVECRVEPGADGRPCAARSATAGAGSAARTRRGCSSVTGAHRRPAGNQRRRAGMAFVKAVVERHEGTIHAQRHAAGHHGHDHAAGRGTSMTMAPAPPAASGRHGTAAPPDSSIYSIEPFSGQPRATTPFAGSPQPAWNCSP